ncbi:MAG: ribonuclease domain-containing protein, partial [Stappiaceae bacterium]|uniref:ribonuclease domain-containing protein n=1 Tax=Alphaproteobacteria TaxID=28211 RepID=UPI0032983AC1
TVADLRAQNALKNAQADYMEGARALASDPDTGFLSRTGSAALGGRAGVEQLLNELGQRTAETLPRRVHAQFRDFRTRHDTSILGEYLKHESEQTKVQTQAASQRRVSTLRQEAVRNHTDPVAHLNSLTEAEQEVRTMASWSGLSEAETEQAVVRQYDAVQSDIILQMAEQDPLAAEVRYESFKESLQEESRQNLERIITPAVKIANAEVKAGELFAGLHVDGSADIVEGVTGFLARSVEKNAGILAGTEDSATLTGSAGDDSLEMPEQQQEQPLTEPVALQGPTVERARELEEVGDLLRRRGDALADRMNHAGVMLSPGNLIFAQAMGAPLTIAFNQADPTLPAAEVLAQSLGWTLSADDLTELDQRLEGRSVGDFLTEFSSAAAALSGGPDVAAELGAIVDPEQRQLTEGGLTINLSTANRQRRNTARERITNAFDVIERGGSLSDLSLDQQSALEGPLREAAYDFQKARASTGQSKTDFVLAYSLARLFSNDPVGFAALNLFEFRDRFSEVVFGTLDSWNGLVRNSLERAEETASQVAAVFETSNRFLAQKGIVPGNVDDNDIDAVSRFSFRFLSDVQAFQEAEGRVPTADEMSGIARERQSILSKVSLRNPEDRGEPSEGEPDFPSDENANVFVPLSDFRNTAAFYKVLKQYTRLHDGDKSAARGEVEEIFRGIEKKSREDLTLEQRAIADQIRFEQFSGTPEEKRAYADRIRDEPFDLHAAHVGPVLYYISLKVRGLIEILKVPGDTWKGTYTLPPLGAPGVTEDDGSNVYVNGEFVGNRRAMTRVYNERALGFATSFTGGGLASTAFTGPKAALNPNVLRAGGGKVSKGAGLGRGISPSFSRNSQLTLVQDQQKFKKLLLNAEKNGNTEQIAGFKKELYTIENTILSKLNPSVRVPNLAGSDWVPDSKSFTKVRKLIKQEKELATKRANKFLDELDTTSSPPNGFKKYTNFENRNNELPPNWVKGNVKYIKYDIYKKLEGLDRGWTRVVIGSDNRVYTTFDHYETFVELRRMKPGFFERVTKE